MKGNHNFSGANSNLLTLTDALNHPTTYTYDTSDRVATRTDPLQKQASYGYDKNDHLTQVTDRKQQMTGYQCDDLDRLCDATFARIASTSNQRHVSRRAGGRASVLRTANKV